MALQTIAAPTSTNAYYSTYVRTRSARHDPMSIVASVKVYDGIVLGAESMTQIYANVPERGAATS